MSGATATNPINSGVVTAVFPTTANAVISTAAISGVTAPVAATIPVRSVSGTGYTGIVTWSPSVSSAFAYNTAYTATVTLTAASGYTLTGVAANFFTVSGATATNPINSGVVTAVFPATTSTLPSGYISSGGLTWAPVTTTANWATTASTCNTSTALSLIAGSWRQPTKVELEALKASRAASPRPAGWKDSNYIWSSTLDGGITHVGYDIFSAALRTGNDNNPNDVSCVY